MPFENFAIFLICYVYFIGCFLLFKFDYIVLQHLSCLYFFRLRCFDVSFFLSFDFLVAYSSFGFELELLPCARNLDSVLWNQARLLRLSAIVRFLPWAPVPVEFIYFFVSFCRLLSSMNKGMRFQTPQASHLGS